MSHNYVNGAFVKGSSGETIQVFNPATEESIGAVPRGSAADAKSALEAASNAFPLWRKTSANVRAQMMHDAAAKMRTHKEAIVHLLTLEQGKPIPENEEEVEWLTNTFDYYAELGRHERGRVLPSGEYTQLNLVIKEPYGVALCIVPGIIRYF